MTDFIILLGFFPLLLFTSICNAQTPAEQPPQFDLVIFGSNLDANTAEVRLRENPGSENNWQKLDSGSTISDTKNGFTSILISNLSAEKFAGQDIRENFIAVKVSTAASDKNQEIQAVYALPQAEYTEEDRQKLHVAIQSDPEQVRKYSLANIVFPRAQSLSKNREFTEHIEMPVRHLKPGVQEVKWLDIIFKN